MQASTIAECIGISSDGRTNRWRITCPVCENTFTPPTTRLAWQETNCPKAKCNATLIAKYNDEPPIVFAKQK